MHGSHSGAILSPMQRLIKKAEFARLAGVNASTVTRLARTLLADAMTGDLVDSAHPCARAYLERQKTARLEPAATGMDPLYEKAVEAVRGLGKISVRTLAKAINVSKDRAAKICKVLKANEVLDPLAGWTVSAPIQSDEPKAPPKPRGYTAKKENEKREAAAENKEPTIVPEDMEVFYEMKLIDIVDTYGTDARFVDWLNSVQKLEAINEKRLKNAATRGTLVSRELVQARVIDNIDAAFVRMLTDGRQTLSLRAHTAVKAGGSVEDVDVLVGKLLDSFIKPVKVKIQQALNNA